MNLADIVEQWLIDNKFNCLTKKPGLFAYLGSVKFREDPYINECLFISNDYIEYYVSRPSPPYWRKLYAYDPEFFEKLKKISSLMNRVEARFAKE
jgi:hypothetical protein